MSFKLNRVGKYPALSLFLCLTSCLSLPKTPICYENYDSVNIEQITSDQFKLCCETTMDCTYELYNHFTSDDIEAVAVINQVQCNPDTFVCEYSERSSKTDMGMDGPVPCESLSDCPQAQFCVLGYCVTDPSADRDFDGVPTDVDNCPDISNAQQTDCDTNGIGDACDPAGSCQHTFIGSVKEFSDGRIGNPQPCLYLEIEGENVRLHSDAQGSYTILLPKIEGERRLLGFIGAGRSLENPEVCDQFADAHTAVYSDQPIFEQVISNFDESSAVDLTLRPHGAIRGRALKADYPPMSAEHGGLKVRLLGTSRRATFTDPFGNFSFDYVEPDTRYTIIISSTGYDTQRFNNLVIEEGKTTQLSQGELIFTQSNIDRPSPSTQGRCQVSLTDRSCESGSTDGCGEVCGGGGDLPSSCFNGLICVPESYGQGLSIQPSDTRQILDQEVSIEVKLLNMPKNQSTKSLTPNPQLTIHSVLAGQSYNIELTEGEEDIIVGDELPDYHYEVYRWRGVLPRDDLYHVMASAGVTERIIVARHLYYPLDADPEQEGPVQIQLNLNPQRTFDNQLDEDRDGVSDLDDLDQDGDGCLDEFDAHPRNPYQALPDLMTCSSSAELCPDDDDDGLSDLEELTFGTDGLISSPSSSEMNTPFGFEVNSGDMDRVFDIVTSPLYWRLVHPEYRLGNVNGSPLLFSVAPRVFGDQVPLKIKLQIPVKVPLYIEQSGQGTALQEQAFLMIDEDCPIAASDPTMTPGCLSRTLVVEQQQCTPINGLPYTTCTIEVMLDSAEQPFNEERRLSLWPVHDLITLLGEPEERTLRPVCNQLCLSDTQHKQYLYGLVRRSFAQNQSGTCLFNSIDDADPLNKRPLFVHELLAQCAPIPSLETEWRADHCQVEPLRDERGAVYVLTKVIAQSWPEACAELSEALYSGDQDPILIATDSCRDALRISNGNITMQLDNSLGERSTLEYTVHLGDELGRCIP